MKKKIAVYVLLLSIFVFSIIGYSLTYHVSFQSAHVPGSGGHVYVAAQEKTNTGTSGVGVLTYKSMDYGLEGEMFDQNTGVRGPKRDLPLNSYVTLPSGNGFNNGHIVSLRINSHWIGEPQNVSGSFKAN